MLFVPHVNACHFQTEQLVNTFLSACSEQRAVVLKMINDAEASLFGKVLSV
jgi:hypothetical protein